MGLILLLIMVAVLPAAVSAGAASEAHSCCLQKEMDVSCPCCNSSRSIGKNAPMENPCICVSTVPEPQPAFPEDAGGFSRLTRLMLSDGDNPFIPRFRAGMHPSLPIEQSQFSSGSLLPAYHLRL